MASVLDTGGSLSRKAPSGPLANKLGKQSWSWGSLGVFDHRFLAYPMPHRQLCRGAGA